MSKRQAAVMDVVVRDRSATAEQIAQYVRAITGYPIKATGVVRVLRNLVAIGAVEYVGVNGRVLAVAR